MERLPLPLARLVTNAFRPVVVLLPTGDRKSATEAYCHQCLSACSGVVTSASLAKVLKHLSSHQCLSACSGVVTRQRALRSDAGKNRVTNAFRPVVVLLLAADKAAIAARAVSPMPFGL